MAERDELEFDELEPPPPPPPLPPPPPDELLEDEPPEDEDDDERDELDELDELLDVELDDDEELEAVLLLELEEDPLVSGEDEVLEPLDPSGPVGDVPHPTPNMPTPARATPPDSILRNCRRSSLRVASSTGCGFSD